MKSTKVKLKNFRSFGPQLTEITIQDNLTGIIGANSAGKTALLEAFRKIFGSSSKERVISKADFHIPGNKKPENIDSCEMFIEVIFEFEIEKKEDNGIPSFFEQMVVDHEGCTPYLRVRFESTWSKDPINPEGSIESKLLYITCPEGEDENDSNTLIFPNHKRSLIQSFYVPAIRRPSEQLKFASGSVLFRLFKKVKWPKDFGENFKAKLSELNTLFEGVENFDDIKGSLSTLWKKYNKDSRYNDASITFGSSDFDSILKKLEVEFSPTDVDRPFKITELGEGYRSLFYLTLVSTLLQIEKKFELEVGEVPLLTLLLIEEPENHIAPQLLGRVLNNLNNLAQQDNVQVIISSHTPSIISRIEPEGIRHLRLDEKIHRTIASNIYLPKKTDEAYKFVKEAVRNYPELYFAKLAILGEGDSEEIIFNKLARVYNKNFDNHHISIAPLGGRYVNHIWKLLTQLNIPYVTLLDLDRERGGGGWGRIKYTIKQLIENQPEIKTKLLETESGILSDDELKGMHKWSTTSTEDMNRWIRHLETYDIFFSYPLDLDFMMLSAFESDYAKIAAQGPRIPDKKAEPDDFKEKLKSGIQATLKSLKSTAATYNEKEKELMIWYNYYFLGRGKPSTHILALSEISDKDLITKIPKVLEKMFKRIDEKI